MKPTVSPQEKTDLYKKTSCRYCDSRLPEPFLDLGTMALANSFLTREEASNQEFTCPLRLVWCAVCGLVQLTHAVPPERMFSNYLYVSSTTQTFQKHFSDYAKTAKTKLLKKDSSARAVDIGSNDGLLLACFQNEGMAALGIEPARNLSEAANKKGRTTMNDYFGSSAVDKLLKDGEPADIVTGNNVFAHMDDIQEVLRNVSRLLHPQGVFIIEFPYLVTMIENMLFDMIYHEHLSYIAVTPLQSLLRRFEFEIFAIEEVPSHGGSLRVFIQKKSAGRPVSDEVHRFVRREAEKGYGSFPVYQEFARGVQAVKNELVTLVREIKSRGKSLSGYGAAAKGNTLINFCALSPSQINYLVDDNPLKQNRLSPGAKIPVVTSRYLFENPTDYVILFAWNFASEILKKLTPLKERKTKFIVPLPKPRIIE